ncbi:hypothetical protein MTP99_015162 [Tenebrio molitor]|nr:hypothetical protein MTP99_015162 [Tenebrio molitor]
MSLSLSSPHPSVLILGQQEQKTACARITASFIWQFCKFTSADGTEKTASGASSTINAPKGEKSLRRLRPTSVATLTRPQIGISIIAPITIRPSAN